MHRRDFIKVVAGSAFTWPLRARAQQTVLPVVGFVDAGAADASVARATAFRKGLGEAGYIEGQNVMVEYHWLAGRYESAPTVMADLVRRQVAVIAAPVTSAALAAKAATSTIPIVFAAAGDPIGTGLVASLARPGGNVTGLSNQQTDLAGKRLEQLHRLVPGLQRLAVMGNVYTPNAALEMNEVQSVGPKLGVQVTRLEISKTEDIIPGIESLKGRVDGLYVSTDPLLTTYRTLINTSAIDANLPTVYAFREYVLAGGLMSYGPNFPDLFRRAGDYVDKILRGAKPADIPVEQPIKFDLILNLKTAKALGLTVPEAFMMRANEVIE